jgi:GNAT superfamily N-acetyltransferase
VGTLAKVRNARDDDAGAVSDLANALGYSTTPTEALHRLGRVGGKQDHGIFVAELPDGTVVGWVHVFIAERVESDPFGELGGLVVSQDHRRTGVGRVLVARAEGWCRRRGIGVLRVRTNVVRADAHGFYERLDFKGVKTQAIFEKTVVPRRENGEMPHFPEMRYLLQSVRLRQISSSWFLR